MNTNRTSVGWGSLLQFRVKIVVLRLLHWLAYGISFFGVLVSSNAMSQYGSDDRKIPFDVGNCKMYESEQSARAKQRNAVTGKWDGGCVGGLADGVGIVRMYQHGQLKLISKAEFKNGLGVRAIEVYEKQDGSIKKADMGRKTTSDIPPSQVPEWAREIVDGRPRQSTPASIASQQPSQNSVLASPIAPAARTTSKNSSLVSSARSRLFIAHSENEARPFLVSGEAMLPNVVSSYINRGIADYSEHGLPRMRTEECHPGAGAGPYFAFVQYYVSGSMGWGAACGANSPDEAVRASQRACESRSSYCRVQRGLDKSKQVELIIGDMRTQGEPRVIKTFSVRLKETRPDGGADVGDVIDHGMWHNIPEGFFCFWRSSGDHRDLLIYWNGPFIKKQVGFRPQTLIDFRCSSFLPLY